MAWEDIGRRNQLDARLAGKAFWRLLGCRFQQVIFIFTINHLRIQRSQNVYVSCFQSKDE